MATSNSTGIPLLPWKLRHALRNANKVTTRFWDRSLRFLGCAPLRRVDTPRSWNIPPLEWVQQEGETYRCIFCLRDYRRQSIQRIRDSLQDCANKTLTTLDPSKQWEIPVLLLGSKLRAGDVCLDVGCGSSCLPVWLDGVGCEVYALDPEMRAVSCEWSLPTARIHVNGNFINYIRQSAVDLPLKDNLVDHVFCVSVLEHMPLELIPRAIAEFIRVTKPGGTIAISTDVYPHPEEHMKKDHAHVFNLTDLETHILKPLAGLLPVMPIELTLDEGWEQNLTDARQSFSARHSFFAAVWQKPKEDYLSK